MPSLKEIKGRIGSVQSTLKITSAMKLVASAKLRKAQQTIEGMRPYERKLQGMLDHLVASGAKLSGEYTRTPATGPDAPGQRIALVAFASNSSLCGAFNANAVRLTLETVRSYGEADVTVYSIGRKMADAMRKAGKPSPADYQKLADKPSYAPAAELAEQLMEDFLAGRLDRIDLVYNHFVSSGKQVPVRETLLPMPPGGPRSEVPAPEVLHGPAGQQRLRARRPDRGHADGHRQRRGPPAGAHPAVQQIPPAEDHVGNPGSCRRESAAIGGRRISRYPGF